MNREKIKDILELIKHLACSAELLAQLPSTLRETIIDDLGFLPTPQEMFSIADHLVDFVKETLDAWHMVNQETDAAGIDSKVELFNNRRQELDRLLKNKSK